MHFRKSIYLLLVLALLVSCAACQKQPAETAAPSDVTVPETETQPLPEGDGETSPTAEVIENPVENPITYFAMSLGENYDSVRYLVVYEELGQTYVEYVGEEKKVGTFAVSLLHRLTEQAETVLPEQLNGQSIYEEGEALGSMYITYADGTYLTANFSGTIPEEFIRAYETMDAYLQDVTAELPVYEPKPEILGQVDETVLAQLTEILNTSGIKELDLLVISDIPMDDYFAFTAGLSDSEKLLNGTQCSAMMMTTPYSLVVVTAREEGDVKAIREDFQKSMDWGKWVCVSPTEALIAQKGNLVLCLMGTDALYEFTKAGIEATGWTQVETFVNPQK